MIQRAVILDSVFLSLFDQTTIKPPFNHRFTTAPPRHQHRNNDAILLSHQHRNNAPIQQRSHPTTLPSNDVPIQRRSHPTTLPSYSTQHPSSSLQHHQTAPTTNEHRVDTISTPAQKEQPWCAGFPALFSRLVAFRARVPAQLPRARDGGGAIRAGGQG